MKYLKKFENYSNDDIINDIEDILMELSDIDIEFKITDVFKSTGLNRDNEAIIQIKRKKTATDREIEGAPTPPGGKYDKEIFLWKEVKDVIIRLNQWYYQNFDKKAIKNRSFQNYYQQEKFRNESPFRMFNSEIEFGVGWDKEEDFSNIGDLISFTGLKIIIKL